MNVASSALDLTSAWALFGPPVTRVMLDWSLLFACDAAVSAEPLAYDALERLVSPWYVDLSAGREVSYDDPAGMALRSCEVPDVLTTLEPGRAERMAAIAADCTPGAEAWVVPCYAVGDDLLLLDGNHRVGANFVHRLDARVLAIVIHGPLDPAILPDLARFPASVAKPLP